MKKTYLLYVLTNYYNYWIATTQKASRNDDREDVRLFHDTLIKVEFGAQNLRAVAQMLVSTD